MPARDTVLLVRVYRWPVVRPSSNSVTLLKPLTLSGPWMVASDRTVLKGRLPPTLTAVPNPALSAVPVPAAVPVTTTLVGKDDRSDALLVKARLARES